MTVQFHTKIGREFLVLPKGDDVGCRISEVTTHDEATIEYVASFLCILCTECRYLRHKWVVMSVRLSIRPRVIIYETTEWKVIKFGIVGTVKGVGEFNFGSCASI